MGLSPEKAFVGYSLFEYDDRMAVIRSVRRISPCRAAILPLAFFALAGSLAAEDLPEMRPALLAPGGRSLVDQIDAPSLLKHGQGNSRVFYMCAVNDRGDCGEVVCYSGTPNSWQLEDEIVKKAKWSRYIPAVYHHQKCSAIVYGTIIFLIKDGIPHVRSYLNQDEQHLRALDDFVAPQPVFFRGQKFKGIKYPAESLKVAATVLVQGTVDASGTLQKMELVYERPPGKGFGQAVMDSINDAQFLPGYLHGRPISCTFNFPIIFKIGGTSSRWHSD